MSAPFGWRDAMVAAAANARGRHPSHALNHDPLNHDPIEKARAEGAQMMADWLAQDFEYAASMAPFEGVAYARKMGTPESRAESAKRGRLTEGYGARRARRKATP